MIEETFTFDTLEDAQSYARAYRHSYPSRGYDTRTHVYRAGTDGRYKVTCTRSISCD